VTHTNQWEPGNISEQIHMHSADAPLVDSLAQSTNYCHGYRSSWHEPKEHGIPSTYYSYHGVTDRLYIPGSLQEL